MGDPWGSNDGPEPDEAYVAARSIPTEPGVPAERMSRGARAYWSASDQRPGHAEPVPYQREPSEVAHRVRDVIRTVHASCDPAACSLSRVHAEDVQEILDAAFAVRAAARTACTCEGWFSERGPDEPTRDCPVHGWAAVCTCEPTATGEAPEVPDRDCPVHGLGPPPRRDPAEGVPLIDGEPAF